MKKFIKEYWFQVLVVSLLTITVLQGFQIVSTLNDISVTLDEVEDGIEVEIVDSVDTGVGILPSLPKLPSL